MSNISDVAKRAGVSSMTVSRVINNSGYTSPATRARVERAIAELGYVPNALARGLRFKQTKTIALIVTDITNPFFTTLARGVEDTANQAGFTVIFGNTDESEAKEQNYLQMLLQQQVDGILLVPARSHNIESLRVIQKQNTPVIVLDRRVPPQTQVDVVRCDSEEAAQRLVRMLIELGHQRIGVLSGPRGVSTADDRVQGYRNALRHAGIAEHKNLVYRGAFTQESGYEMAHQLLDVRPRPTAVFAAHNYFAPGVLKRARELRLRVPQDLAIVAFDDLPSTLAHAPFFTVAIQPAYEIGAQATQLLLQRLSGAMETGYQEIILPVEIVVRESSGAPRPERVLA